MISPHAFSTRTAARHVHLRVMATTDLHAHVLPYDYYADRPTPTLGLARTASLIADARAGAANSLLVDNGDFLQGNPMGDLFAQPGLLANGKVHPIFAAMNRLGYDAATLGNHEFNYGLDFLMSALRGTAFPVISANIAIRQGAHPRKDTTLLRPYVILERQLADGAGTAHPIKIGVIGFAPPQIVQWDRNHLEGRVTTRDILAAAWGWVPEMREAGCDVIIALSHSGIGPAGASDGMENASTPLARLPGIDAIVTGHSHLVFPSPAFAGLADVDAQAGTIAGKPAVMAGFWGSHLGLIDLLLERDGTAWQVIASTSEARPIWQRGADGKPNALVASDPRVQASVAIEHAATLASVRRPVGRTALALNTYFALVTPSPAVGMVAEAQARHLAPLLRGTAHDGLPILSACAPFKTGGRGGPENFTDIPRGDMALRHAADMYVYPNTLTALRLTGAEVAEWLEHTVGIFARITPGLPDQPLINPDFPSYNFDLIHGLTFRIDLAQRSRYYPDGSLADTNARRITGLAQDGLALNPEAEFIIASNNFRASGNGGFTTAPPVLCETTHIRDLLLRHIAHASPLTAPATPFWRFVPMPGTSVTFATAPAARQHLPAVAHLRLTDLGDTPDGFVRFRLAL